MTSEPLSFPRQYARTQRFTLGAPRTFRVSPDGERVIFLRSRSGTDRANLLWVLDLATGAERVVADPSQLLAGGTERLSPAERARRERLREGGAGIVGYATDDAAELAAFTLSGRLFVAEPRTGAVRELAVPGPVIDPRPSPDGRHVAYVSDGALRVVRVAADDGTGGGPDDRALAAPEAATVTYGLAEFIAAEEMERSRGFWWAPGSDRLLVARADDAPVRRWWITDPAHPDRAPEQIAYPLAGSPNAEVRLFALGLDGSRTEVVHDRERYPYLARVHWSAAGPPLLLVQARDQRSQVYLAVDPDSGSTRMVHAEDAEPWLDLFPGVPCWTPDGRLVRITDEGGARVLAVGDRPLTGAQLHVRAVLDVSADDVLVSASAGAEAADPETGEVHVYRVGELGVERLSREPGVHGATRSGEVTVLISAVPHTPGARTRVWRDDKPVAEVTSHAERPDLTPRVTLTEGGTRRIPCAVLLPSDHPVDGAPLPVLLDPYGGPHAARVHAAHNAYLTSQWYADQGFAVVVADGRGTPHRSPGWEKAIHQDLTVTLDDQIDALQGLAGRFPLDLSRVAIRGWSYGGYLAALAVLRRPDVFHAAVAGAPVTDWRLYDTHYTERYLGDPAEHPAVYAANSLVTDDGLSAPAGQHRPLMIVHGLADDNVVFGHSLRLSSALLAAGRPHEVLPLSGVTHMAAQEEVAENLLLLQVDFLRRSLGPR
ncbi:prolyl oligopeptidase family serine peptidase [Streptomyces sp. SID4919]|uniref:S9 family peptidase n=1 Tax=unclassified Streptomyces TaxID=2593676 RepID=UPI000823BE65|nr:MULTISPECIES: prolyl oligopeptidase family serine peptidase [unclassified Streptomyces]MYY11248.1 prolyl oligopeptidase family serine peptidase [Streptomyces sp. SID4919]SCK16861.1 dipeptidyl-peptidase-4 [Streptomyces sp. AmelKG-E11A]